MYLVAAFCLGPAAVWAQDAPTAGDSAVDSSTTGAESDFDGLFEDSAEDEDGAGEADSDTEEDVPAMEQVDGRVRRDDMDELVVTATKRSESVQDVPISVTALGGGFLEETGTTQFNQIQQFVPNLQILPVTDTRSTSIRIRGIGSVGSNAGIDPSVGVFIDGIYQGRAGMSVGDLVDIERIEVLRGPQGTLYGKNTAAGAINIITKNPSPDGEIFAETVVGNYSALEFRGSVNAPLIEDKLAARFSGYRSVRKGYDVNRYTGERVNNSDKYGVRGKLRWMGTEGIDIVLNGDFSEDISKCCVGDILTYQGPSALGADFNDIAAVDGKALPVEDPFDRIVGANDEPRNHVRVGGVSLDANFDVGEHSLRWLTGYRSYGSDGQFDGDFTWYDVVKSKTLVDYYQVSSELLFASPGGETIDYQTGLYIYYSKLDTDDTLGYTQLLVDASSIGPLLNPAENYNVNDHQTFTVAGFGQGTWNIGDAWSLTGGFRLDWEKKTRVGSSTSDCNIPAPPVCGPDDFRDEERSVVNPQGTVIARYRPTDTTMIYASFANGFKSGGFNQIRTTADSSGNPLKSEFDDERSFNYELGTKTTWFDGDVLFNLTGYFTDYRDFQAQLFNGTSIVVDNAGRMFAGGIESEFRYIPDFIPDRGLVTGGSIGLNYTKYKDFTDAPATVPQMAAETGFPDVYAVACATGNFDCSQDLTGERIDNAPRLSMSLYASYEKEIPTTPISWFARGDYLLETFKYLDADLDPNLQQSPLNLLNLRTGIKAEDGMWELTFWMNNVTDQQWFVTGSDVPIISGYFVVLAPPRTYGGTFRVNF